MNVLLYQFPPDLRNGHATIFAIPVEFKHDARVISAFLKSEGLYTFSEPTEHVPLEEVPGRYTCSIVDGEHFLTAARGWWAARSKKAAP